MVRPGPSDFDLKTDIGIWRCGLPAFSFLRWDGMGRYVLTFIQMLHVSQARAILRDVISSNCQTSMTARGLSEDFAWEPRIRASLLNGLHRMRWRRWMTGTLAWWEWRVPQPIQFSNQVPFSVWIAIWMDLDLARSWDVGIHRRLQTVVSREWLECAAKECWWLMWFEPIFRALRHGPRVDRVAMPLQRSSVFAWPLWNGCSRKVLCCQLMYSSIYFTSCSSEIY